MAIVDSLDLMIELGESACKLIHLFNKFVLLVTLFCIGKVDEKPSPLKIIQPVVNSNSLSRPVEKSKPPVKKVTLSKPAPTEFKTAPTK